MARAFAVEAVVERPAEEVWAALTDWDNAHRWMAGVDKVSVEPGTADPMILNFRAQGKDRVAEVVTVEQGRSISIRSSQGKVSAVYDYETEPLDDDRTAVRLVADCSTTGALFSALSPLLRFVIKRTDSGQIDALKAVIENS